MQKINDLLQKNIMKIFIIFLFMQPILDIITSVSLYKFNINLTIGMVIRMIFMIFEMYYILFIAKLKKYNKVIFLLLIYFIMYVLTNFMFKSNFNFLYEIRNLINIIYMPITLIFTYQILKNNEFKTKNLYIILLIYLILIFVPNILHIGFKSYAYSKTGSVGFFYSANAIGSLISFLTPCFIGYLVINRKYKSLILFTIMYLYVLVSMGTKSPLLCFLIILLYYFIYLIINMIRNKKYKQISIIIIITVVLTILFMIFVKYTAFYKNLLIHLNYLKIKKFSDLLTLKNIDHFIFSSRLLFFKNSFILFLKSSLMQKLFGIGYIVNNKIIKIVEMDYLDTFIHHGIVGFIVIYYTYFKMVNHIFKSYFDEFKKNYMDKEKSSCMLSIFISILCAFLTGHVLGTPSVSIFSSLMLVICYNNLSKGESLDEKIQIKTTKKI